MSIANKANFPKDFNVQIVCLPVELINHIRNIGMSKTKTNHSLVFLDLLLNMVIINKKEVKNYFPIGAKYLRKVFNSRYSEWLKILLEKSLVESDGVWIQFIGKSLGYRINSKLVTNWDDIDVVKIKTKKGHGHSEVDLKYYKELVNFHNSIRIDYDLLQRITAKYVKGHESEMSFKRFSWLRSARLLEHNFLSAKRSPTNNRLNTNYTTLPNPLFNEIKRNNNLLEIDAVNSQFAILANMIRDRVDDDFIDDAIYGNLYENVAAKLGCDRNEAKIAMLKTVYSKAIYENKQKALIRELYPETIALLDRYKTKKSHRELAIAMQKKESEIYIDGVLEKLYNLGIIAISKHDSIIFNSKDKIQVEKIVDDILASMGFELKIKVSN